MRLQVFRTVLLRISLMSRRWMSRSQCFEKQSAIIFRGLEIQKCDFRVLGCWFVSFNQNYGLSLEIGHSKISECFRYFYRGVME
jgi:hypothetical protein